MHQILDLISPVHTAVILYTQWFVIIRSVRVKQVTVWAATYIAVLFFEIRLRQVLTNSDYFSQFERLRMISS